MARSSTDRFDAKLGFVGMTAFIPLTLLTVGNAIPSLRGPFQIAAAASTPLALFVGWRFALKSLFGNRVMREYREETGKTNRDLLREELKAAAAGHELAGSVFDKAHPAPKP